MNSVYNSVDKKEEVTMNHFIGWKFGVPVKVFIYGGEGRLLDDQRLINEDATSFQTILPDRRVHQYFKVKTHYELIPHSVEGGVKPRYPVCVSSEHAAYCNCIGKMAGFAAGKIIESPVPASPATLNIEGKTIKLSAETAAELKKQLGV